MPTQLKTGIRWDDANNPYFGFNLPTNYHQLSEAAQKHARLNAVRTRDTPEDVVRGWNFFRHYYLFSLPTGQFYKRRVSSPMEHFRWIYCMARYARNLIAAPRSYAKSIVVGKEWPMYLALSRPPLEVLTLVSEKSKATRRGQEFASMFTRNPRIITDFGDLRGNPRREQRMWSFSNMHLSNGSKLNVSSIGSRQLGERPDYIILDDVEPDPQLYKDAWEQVVEDLVNAMFNVYLPMLDGGSAMTAIGTLLHRRSWLYWAMHTNDGRLGFWNRTLTAIEDHLGRPTWTEKFPPAEIARLKRELGPAAFAAQYLNRPSSGEECVLQWHSKRTAYDLTGQDTELGTDPLKSQATLIHYESEQKDEPEFSPKWKEVRRPFGPTVKNMFRFLTVDYAQKTHDRADYSAVNCLGLDSSDVLWDLDLWVGRIDLEALCKKIWQMCYKWSVKVIGIEAIGIYQALYDRMIRERGRVEREMGWLPRIVRIKYPPHLSKETRIASISWRFTDGRIRVPNRLDGPWKMLRYQIDNFTEDGKNLRHDDAIDTVAMTPFVAAPRIPKQLNQDEADKRRKTFAERLVAGERIDPVSGIPYVTGMNAEEVPISALRKLAYKERPPNGRQLVGAHLPPMFDLNDVAAAMEAANNELQRTPVSQL